MFEYRTTDREDTTIPKVYPIRTIHLNIPDEKYYNYKLSQLKKEYKSKTISFTISPINTTVVQNSKFNILLVYNVILRKIQPVKVHYIFETTFDGKIHIHGLLKYNKKFNFDLFNNYFTGVDLNFKKYYSDNWIEYMMKQFPNNIYNNYRQGLGYKNKNILLY